MNLGDKKEKNETENSSGVFACIKFDNFYKYKIPAGIFAWVVILIQRRKTARIYKPNRVK